MHLCLSALIFVILTGIFGMTTYITTEIGKIGGTCDLLYSDDNILTETELQKKADSVGLSTGLIDSTTSKNSTTSICSSECSGNWKGINACESLNTTECTMGYYKKNAPFRQCGILCNICQEIDKFCSNNPNPNTIPPRKWQSSQHTLICNNSNSTMAFDTTDHGTCETYSDYIREYNGAKNGSMILSLSTPYPGAGQVLPTFQDYLYDCRYSFEGNSNCENDAYSTAGGYHGSQMYVPTNWSTLSCPYTGHTSYGPHVKIWDSPCNLQPPLQNSSDLFEYHEGFLLFQYRPETNTRQYLEQTTWFFRPPQCISNNDKYVPYYSLISDEIEYFQLSTFCSTAIYYPLYANLVCTLNGTNSNPTIIPDKTFNSYQYINNKFQCNKNNYKTGFWYSFYRISESECDPNSPWECVSDTNQPTILACDKGEDITSLANCSLEITTPLQSLKQDNVTCKMVNQKQQYTSIDEENIRQLYVPAYCKCDDGISFLPTVLINGEIQPYSKCDRPSVIQRFI